MSINDDIQATIDSLRSAGAEIDRLREERDKLVIFIYEEVATSGWCDPQVNNEAITLLADLGLDPKGA